MSIKLYFHCLLKGEYFDPSPLLSNPNINIKNYNFHGDRSRFTNFPYDFGSVNFGSNVSSIDEFLDLLLNKEIKSVIEKAEHKELHIFLEYVNQCNWEFSLNEIRKINSLGLILTISCDTAM